MAVVRNLAFFVKEKDRIKNKRESMRTQCSQYNYNKKNLYFTIIYLYKKEMKTLGLNKKKQLWWTLSIGKIIKL